MSVAAELGAADSLALEDVCAVWMLALAAKVLA